MVCRLIEQQEIGAGKHELQYGQPRLFTAAEAVYFLIYIVTRKQKAAEQGAHPCLGEIAVFIPYLIYRRFGIVKR